MKRHLLLFLAACVLGAAGTGFSFLVVSGGNPFPGYHYETHGFPYWYANYYTDDLSGPASYFSLVSAVLDFGFWAFLGAGLAFAVFQVRKHGLRRSSHPRSPSRGSSPGSRERPGVRERLTAASVQRV